jgi:CHAD domain-containing protein
MEMQKYALQQARSLLGRVAFEARHVVKSATPDSVHDLRVSIRRLSQCLRAFRGFFPRGAAKRVRQQLRPVMDEASEVRNRDIAVELSRKAGLPADSPLFTELSLERKQACHLLARCLEQWNDRNRFGKWRSALGL